MTRTAGHDASGTADRGRHTTPDPGAVRSVWGGLARWGRGLPLRLLAATALVVDAVIHAQLVHRYDLNTAGGLSQGDLFRIEAGIAALAAVVVVLTARRIGWVFVLLVAASALVVLLLSTYVHLGQVGPVPDMYEPAWYPRKVIATVAEAMGTVVAIGVLAGPAIGRRRGG